MSWLIGTCHFGIGRKHTFPDRFVVPCAIREAPVRGDQEMRATGMYEE